MRSLKPNGVGPSIDSSNIISLWIANAKDISAEFLRGFEGMTEEPVSRDELIAARETLITEIVGRMPDSHRRFLVSFERGEPDWALLDVPGAPNCLL